MLKEDVPYWVAEVERDPKRLEDIGSVMPKLLILSIVRARKAAQDAIVEVFFEK
jgi:hypothetical protein